VGLKAIRISIGGGEFKGKSIPLPPAVAGHRHFTPSLLKEAAFQILANTVPSGPFWDLCSGSGQMALEALSRGYEPVHLVELDRQRFQWLKNRVCPGYKVTLHNKDFVRVAPLILTEPRSAVCFIDLPYSFWNRDGSCERLEGFFESIRKHSPGGSVPCILVQAPDRWKILSPELGAWIENTYIAESRDYRGQWLHLFQPAH
tara:strand:+ start:1004 stop:1609 length:606 start_codon:yes stop_codon:yes gene_type:complete